MIAVDLTYTPRLTRAEQKMLALPNKMRNIRSVMRNQLAPAMVRMLLKHWETYGAAFNHDWAPWSPNTRKRRERKGTAEKGLLRDEDHLFKSIFRERANDDRLRVVDGGLELHFNTRVPYAVFHQVGTRFMPERQVFPHPMPESFRREARGILRLFLLGEASA